MKQETLEEAFEKNAKYLDDFENKNTYEYGFKDGAKWQMEISYSEEELLEILASYADWSINGDCTYYEWLEQVKKK